MEGDLYAQFAQQLNISDPVNNINDINEETQQDEFNQEISGNCNLIVNYLPHDIDDLSLRALFQEFGEIVMTKVVRDKNTKKSLGYGFVKFGKEYEALHALEKMNGYILGHKVLKVSVARPPSLEIRNCKLYVTNLPKEYTEREVISLFKEFGEIIECRVLKDRNTQVNKGVAFVQFNVKAQANSALSLNGCQLEGSTRGLVVKYAEDQHKKKELSRLQHLTLNQNFRGNPAGPGGPQQNMGMGMGGPGGPQNKLRMDGGKPEMLNPYFYAQAPPHGMPHPPPGAMYGQPPSPMHLIHSPITNGPMYMPPSPPSPMHAAAAAQMSQADFNQKRLNGKGQRGRFNFDGMPPQGAPGGPGGGPMGSPAAYGIYAPQQLPPYLTGAGVPSHMGMQMVSQPGPGAYGPPPGSYGAPMRSNFGPLGGPPHEMDGGMGGNYVAQPPHGMDPNSVPPPMMKNMFTNA